MPQVAIRFQTGTYERIQGAVRDRGYRSVSDFVRAAVDREIGPQNELSEIEQRLVATLATQVREIARLHTAQQALFAMVDALVKTFLTCVPAPPEDASDSAKRMAKQRYDRFLRAVATAMTGDSRAALVDLVNRDAQG
jgi:Arc/MetJ-type ribon-helix-helix transcriptional regulator